MRAHPRIRKTVKWVGAAVTVLLVVVWIGSRWREAGWFSANFGFTVDAGRLNFGKPGWIVRDPAGYWFTLRKEPNAPFWFGAQAHFDGYWWIGVPVWALSVIPLVAAVFAWRLDIAARRRDRVNLCLKCNYDRSGLAARSVCPECGSPGA